jgi:hypothetical protein
LLTIASRELSIRSREPWFGFVRVKSGQRKKKQSGHRPARAHAPEDSRPLPSRETACVCSPSAQVRLRVFPSGLAQLARLLALGPSVSCDRPPASLVCLSLPLVWTAVRARPQTLSVVRRPDCFPVFGSFCQFSFAGFDCNFDRYYSIPIAARKSTGKIVLY